MPGTRLDAVGEVHRLILSVTVQGNRGEVR